MIARPVQLMARAPIPGRVKTRLSAVLGPEGACAVYERLLTDLLDRLEPVLAGATLWVDGPADHPVIVALARRHALPVRSQPPGDLGARMQAILDQAFADGSSGVLVGSDLPTLGAAHVRAARAALGSGAAAAFAPAEDGGYGLVALARPLPELFRAMPWSTERVLAESLARLRTSGVPEEQVALLDTVWDVDEPEDLERLFALPAYGDLRDRWDRHGPAGSARRDRAV